MYMYELLLNYIYKSYVTVINFLKVNNSLKIVTRYFHVKGIWRESLSYPSIRTEAVLYKFGRFIKYFVVQW